MSRHYKDETLTIRVNSLLKDKFGIATGFSGISATLNIFMNDYVRKYEQQYGVIPLTMNSKEKYDIITKFFGVKINKKIMQDYDIEDTCTLINEKYGTDLSVQDMKFFIENYPKTRNLDTYQIFDNKGDLTSL